MKRLGLSRWAAILALAVAPAMTPAFAEDLGTVTITGTFTLDEVTGTVGSDLVDAFVDGGENTWSLTMYGTTYSHVTSTYQNVIHRMTNVYATSFDLEFSGPAADVLNPIVDDELAGGTVTLQLRNADQSSSSDFSTMHLFITPVGGYGTGLSFWAGDELDAPYELFPTDANGYPVVESDPFSFWVESTQFIDHRAGASGALISWYDDTTIEGSLGSPIPTTLSISDGSVLEGSRGSSKLTLQVRLTNTSDDTITVDYRTVAGTALAKSDFTSASGTLTFQPGETAKSITISIKTDRVREADESFSVELYNASGATIDDAVAAATIRNDD